MTFSWSLSNKYRQAEASVQPYDDYKPRGQFFLLLVDDDGFRLGALGLVPYITKGTCGDDGSIVDV